GAGELDDHRGARLDLMRVVRAARERFDLDFVAADLSGDPGEGRVGRDDAYLRAGRPDERSGQQRGAEKQEYLFHGTSFQEGVQVFGSSGGLPEHLLLL